MIFPRSLQDLVMFFVPGGLWNCRRKGFTTISTRGRYWSTSPIQEDILLCFTSWQPNGERVPCERSKKQARQNVPTPGGVGHLLSHRALAGTFNCIKKHDAKKRKTIGSFGNKPKLTVC